MLPQRVPSAHKQEIDPGSLPGEQSRTDKLASREEIKR
jgi:hypothetical protein